MRALRPRRGAPRPRCRRRRHRRAGVVDARRRRSPRCAVSPRRPGSHLLELPFGRARLEPWPHVPRDGTATARGPGDPEPHPPRSSGPARGRHGARRPHARTWRPARGCSTSTARGRPRRACISRRGCRTARPPAAPAPAPASRRRAHGAVVAGDCNFWGPGVDGVPARVVTHGARSHLAAPAARTARSTTSWCAAVTPGRRWSTTRCCPRSVPTTGRCGQHSACPDRNDADASSVSRGRVEEALDLRHHVRRKAAAAGVVAQRRRRPRPGRCNRSCRR